MGKKLRPKKRKKSLLRPRCKIAVKNMIDVVKVKQFSMPLNIKQTTLTASRYFNAGTLTQQLSTHDGTYVTPRPYWG